MYINNTMCEKETRNKQSVSCVVDDATTLVRLYFYFLFRIENWFQQYRHGVIHA